ncbi:hypothetical protein D9M73_65080 [compost metagenome]
MNASKLRLSRGHRARAATNHAKLEEKMVNRVHLRSKTKQSISLPKGVRLIDSSFGDFGREFNVLIEAPTHMDFITKPGDFFEVVSVERRRGS